MKKASRNSKKTKSTKLVVHVQNRRKGKSGHGTSRSFSLISSWDIAEILNFEHDEILELIDLATDAWTRRADYQLRIEFDDQGNEIESYAFDLQSVLGFARHITALSSDGWAEEAIIKAIESRMIEASKAISEIIGLAKEAQNIARNIQRSFQDRLDKQCDDCSYQKALNGVTTVLVMRNQEVNELRDQVAELERMRNTGL